MVDEDPLLAFVTSQVDCYRSGLFGLELGLVLDDECPDIVSHSQQLRPLLLVERDGKTAEAVH